MMAATVGSQSNWRALGLIALAAVGWRSMGCGPTTTTEPFDENTVLSRMLASYGPELVDPAYARLATDAGALAGALDAWAAAPLDELAWDDAGAAWLDAMASWQHAAVLSVGPAQSSLLTPEGGDLGEEIYSWPTTNACRLDQEVVAAGWEAEGYLDGLLVNVRGLDAIEYLLFQEPGANACPPQVDINADGSWAALGLEEQQRRRAALASVLAEGVASVADQVLAAWDPSEGGFGQALARPGTVYSSQNEALDAVYQALYYMEREVKDTKLGAALGYGSCAGICPEELESPWADAGFAHIAANLDGARVVMEGGTSGVGLVALLTEMGEADLAQRMLAGLDEAEAYLAGLEQSPRELAAADPDALEGLYQALKSFTDPLKNEVPLVLLVTVPQEGGVDTD